ncbi:MAG: hypothetical protein AAF532_13505 [Planctomycetota bacterium]
MLRDLALIATPLVVFLALTAIAFVVTTAVDGPAVADGDREGLDDRAPTVAVAAVGATKG